MMELSVDLYAIAKRFGVYKAVEMAKEAGFDAIDFSYCWEMESEEILGDQYDAYALELRQHLDKTGIKCNQAHAPFSIEYGCSFDLTDAKYRTIVHAIGSAAILGASNIVVHAICVPDGVDFEAYNLEFYKSLIPYCDKFGIRMAVENLFIYDWKREYFRGLFGSPDALNRIVKKLDSPWVAACVDVGHAALTGYEPEAFLQAMDPDILACLHIQDNDYRDDRHTIPYAGELNWADIMAALKKMGYQGDLTMEIFTYLNRFPDPILADALKMAASVGRYLISLME